MIEHELPQLHHVRVHLLVHADLQIPLTVLDHRRHQRVNALAVRLTQAFPQMLRNIVLADNARAYRVINIMVDVGNAVGKVDNAAFRRTRLASAGMADNAVAHLARKVQILEHIHNAQTLLVVPKPEWTSLVKRRLSGVAERRVPEIMSKCDRFGQILVESERPRDGPRNLRDLERMRQPSTVVVTLRRDKYLRLVAQPPERL